MNGRSACFQKAATRSLRRCVGLSLARAKGSNPVWPLAHTGLIYEDDGSALFGAVSLASATASAARPLAGEVQSLEQPPHARLRIPLAADLSMSLPTRESVHRSVAYPRTKAPASSATTNRFFSASVSRGGRPVRGALRRARRPFASSACSHRHTDVRLTWSRRATSAGLAPRRSKRAPSKRRASSSARSRFLIMTASLPSKTRSSDVAAVTQFIKGQ